MVFVRSNKMEPPMDKTVPVGDLNSDKIWYQVLFIKPNSGGKKVSQILDARPKKEFKEFSLQDSKETIKDCLPSKGVEFPEQLINDLFSSSVVLSNYYTTNRCLLQTRKISQLIARSWWAYRIYKCFLTSLEAENLRRRKDHELEKDDQYYYHNGNWEELLSDLDFFLRTNSDPSSGEKIYINHLKKDIKENEIEKIVLDILDGLIAREIFLTANSSPKDITKINTWNDNKDIYDPDPSRICGESPEKIMQILPNNRSWTGIRLALLFAGQVFRNEYKREIISDEQGELKKAKYDVVSDKYYQICQPIMSTSEIVSHYDIELSMNAFNAQIDEIPMGLNFDLPFLKVIIPYPPIPTADQVKTEQLEKWFTAEDDGGELNFFCKNESGKYTTTIQNPTPPYPYIPISTS